jgi:hypothetical protein
VRQGEEIGLLWDKMTQNSFVLSEIKGNQGKSSPRAGNFFQKTL